METRKKPILFAILAAVCYGVSTPASKLLLRGLPPVRMAAFLYLGAGVGMAAVVCLRAAKRPAGREARVTRRELPYVIGMILLDIAAPVLLLLGLTVTAPATASLLGSFETVATAVIALLVFREAVGRRMWAAIALITAASALLSYGEMGALSFSPGALLVLLACVCWGLENNCTRMLSLKDPLEIVAVKGIGAGMGALFLSLAVGEGGASAVYIALALLLGLFSYGLSICFYILAQRALGAARTSAYYAAAPFVGAGLSMPLFGQKITAAFAAALILMAAGVCLAAWERHSHRHAHDPVEHEHRHSHADGHHTHTHAFPVGEHSHMHAHEAAEHSHPHNPDAHHTHRHGG